MILLSSTKIAFDKSVKFECCFCYECYSLESVAIGKPFLRIKFYISDAVHISRVILKRKLY